MNQSNTQVTPVPSGVTTVITGVPPGTNGGYAFITVAYAAGAGSNSVMCVWSIAGGSTGPYGTNGTPWASRNYAGTVPVVMANADGNLTCNPSVSGICYCTYFTN